MRLATFGLLGALLMSASPVGAACEATPGIERFARSGWGFGERNLRFQAETEIDRTNVSTLELAWAFALDGGRSPHSYPLVTEDTVFIGTPAGSLFALERDSGCVRWKREIRSSIRTALIHAEVAGNARLVFGTGDGWAEQFTENDTFNMSCLVAPDHPSCPEEVGPDYDFGAPPILARVPSGEQILLAGQKSGGVFAMKPDSGARIWERQLGRGGYLGGVHWGMAVNEALGLLYVPISDRAVGPAASDKPMPGLHALEVETGVVRWSAIHPDRCDGRKGCDSGTSAAIVATPDLVFAGSLDGQVSVYDARTGEVVWSYDTWRKFDSVNGEAAGGGSIDVHGPMVAGDMLLIQSGYGQHGQAGGNALLAFRLPRSAADAQSMSPE